MNRKRYQEEEKKEDLELTPKIQHMRKVFENEEKVKEKNKTVSSHYELNEKGKIILKSIKANGNVTSTYMGSLISTPDLYKRLKSEGKI